MGSPIRVLLPLLLAVAATGCGKSVRFEGTIVLDEIEAPDPALLYISISTESGEAAPEPTTEDPDARAWQKTANGDAIEFVLEFEGNETALGARFWYDTNGDGVAGPGDRVGRLPRAITGRDNGLVVGNVTTLDPLHLTKEPTPKVEPAAKSGTKPSIRPTEKPGATPADKPADKPGAKPADKPGAKPADKPGTKRADKAAVKPPTKPMGKPAAK